MRSDLQSTWHAAFWATVCLMAQLFAAAGLRADDPPGTRIVSVRSVYTFADGRRVVVEESTEATKAAAAASSNGCQKCGDKCDCVGGCGCEATSWLATCGAAPVVKRTGVPCDAQGNTLAAPVTYTAPPVYVGPPVYTYSPPGGYYGGTYYAPMPDAPTPPSVYGPPPRFGVGFGVRGPRGGGFQAQACVGGT